MLQRCDQFYCGAKVTFWLSDSASLEAFKKMTVAKGKTAGQRLAMCLVEIDDDEQPKIPVQEKPKGGALSVWLALRCKEQGFWDFVEAKGYAPVNSEQDCNEAVKLFLGIDSKSEIDNDKEAEARFHSMIRLPYSRWLLGDKNGLAQQVGEV